MNKFSLGNTDLDAEHNALQSMAHIMAWKWKSDLESAECQFSVEGLKSQLEVFKGDYEELNTLYELHRKRIKDFREKGEGFK